MTAPLFSPPQLRLPREQRDRHATWLELFYDLAFAISVDALCQRLNQHVSALALIQFTALFLIIWWAWLGHAVYDTRFDSDDFIQRLLTFGLMLAAVGLALEVPGAFEDGSQGFALSYILARSCLLALYLRAYYYATEVRNISAFYLKGFGLGWFCWIISLFLPVPLKYFFWAIGLVIEFATPWLGRPILKNAPVDTTHLPERLATFLLIVLGEMLLVIAGGVREEHLAGVALVVAFLAFCLIVCIWWVYFTFFDEAPFVRNLSSGQPYIYAHMPILIGIMVEAVGLEQAVSQAREPALKVQALWLLGLGIGLWLLAGLVIKLVSMGRELPTITIIRHLAMVALVGTILFTVGSRLVPVLVLGILVLLFVIFVALEMRQWEHR